MKLRTPRIRTGCAKRRRAGFTLAEVLAALVFMAIVLPVAVDGLRLASQVGQVGQRRAVAARIAESVLNELMLTRQLQGAGQSGIVREGLRDYEWSVTRTPWQVDRMDLVTVQVIFRVQGRPYDVQVSTLTASGSL